MSHLRHSNSNLSLVNFRELQKIKKAVEKLETEPTYHNLKVVSDQELLEMSPEEWSFLTGEGIKE